MGVQPILKKRNMITLNYDVSLATAGAEAVLGRKKRLRRLPHVFAKVLELPFASEADVTVTEGPDELRFVAATGDVFGDDVRAHAVELHPGVTKLVVRDGEDDGEKELELDRWRFRLPQCTRPALATAEYVDGELIVTVPKSTDPEELGGGVMLLSLLA